jgi:group II intron reverse transcriptase/maturase
MTNKPFDIPRYQFHEAFEEVKANKGAPGIDEVSIRQYEEALDDNLYKLWNRMSSGTYFPKPVKQVLIPKKNGKFRPLGIPTIEDRVAQTVAKNAIEPILEEVFIEDSYGYRPGKSAIDAIGKARKMCWKYDWLVEFDIVGLFDNIDHGLLFKAIDFHIEEKWVRLYLKRWSTAPVIDKDGNEIKRDSGVSQGGVTSPAMANLFMHYAFDLWMARTFSQCPYERFADDAVIHCESERQAKIVLAALDGRMKECGLELHPDKTRIVYCKDDNRTNDYKDTSFDFLGYTFRARRSKNNRTGGLFTAFLPAVSKESTQRFKDKVRGMNLYSMVHFDLNMIAEILNPVVRGWMNYYGHFCPSEMAKALRFLNDTLKRWVRKKYKRMKSWKKANKWLSGVIVRQPHLFYHWSQGYAYC